MRQIQTWFGQLASLLGTVAVVCFFLWLPFLSGSGLSEAIREVGRIHTYLDVLSAQPSLSAVAFADSPSGRTVVLEGTVSDRTPPIFRDTLVIFVHYTYIDNARSSGWREHERMLRPLVIEIGSPNAHVSVENPSASAPPAAYDVYDLTRHVDESASRWYGLVHGEPVVVVGTVVQGGEQPYLDARMVCADDRARCVVTLEQERRNKMGGATILSIITLALSAVALVVIGSVIGGIGRDRRRI